MKKLVYIVSIVAIGLLICGAYAGIFNGEDIANNNSSLGDVKDISSDIKDINSNPVINNPINKVIVKDVMSIPKDNIVQIDNSKFIDFANMYACGIDDDSFKFNDDSIYSKFSTEDLSNYSANLNKKIIITHEEGTDTYYPSEEAAHTEIDARREANSVDPSFVSSNPNPINVPSISDILN